VEVLSGPEDLPFRDDASIASSVLPKAALSALGPSSPKIDAPGSMFPLVAVATRARRRAIDGGAGAGASVSSPFTYFLRLVEMNRLKGGCTQRGDCTGAAVSDDCGPGWEGLAARYRSV
jgi:hypothetical protein